MTSLYNKYRSQTFAEVLGQDSIVASLCRDIENDNPSNAYLFSGPRGTGKTSTARIFAKALNCTSRAQGEVEPCNVCESCIEITGDNSFDVKEYDAASYSGVDGMRDIMSKVNVATPGRYKVYIFDEIHQLSRQASDASLKTIEEPPENVIFILATSELHKVPDTMKSRCRKKEFSLLPNDTLSALLHNVVRKEKLLVSEKDIAVAVQKAKGSARDALSALEVSVEEEVSYAEQIVDALSTQDIKKCLITVAQACAGGRLIRILAEQTCDLLRECFLTQMGVPELHSSWPDNEEVAQRIGPRNTVRALEMIGESIVSMRADLDARVNFEIALARYCKS